MADAKAFTSTPDVAAGNPIDVTTVTTAAGSVDRQRIGIGDPAGVNPDVQPTAAGELPIHAAALPLPTGASTEATLALIKAKTDNLDVALSTRTKPADSQTVTGTVASTVADGANVNQGANADAAVTGDTAGTISGKLRGLLKIITAVFDAGSNALVIEGTGAGGSAHAVSVVQAGPFNIKDTVGGSILVAAKGTQVATLLGVQDAKDSGRVSKVLSAFKFTPATTEAMVTLTPISGGVAGATGTSFAVTAGKTWRLQSMMVVVEDSSTTAVGVAVYLRINASGAAIVTSPLIAAVAAALDGTQIARQATSNQVTFSDGLEISGAMQIGISQQGVATADATVVLVGYEY